MSRKASEKAANAISRPKTEFSTTEIEELIVEHNLYDVSLDGLVVECYGKTALHYSIIAKHENIVNCFKEFDGK